MLLHIEPDLGNTDLKTLLETRSYESLRSSFKTVALLFLFYLHMYMCFSFCFFFLADTEVSGRGKISAFFRSKAKPSGQSCVKAEYCSKRSCLCFLKHLTGNIKSGFQSCYFLGFIHLYSTSLTCQTPLYLFLSFSPLALSIAPITSTLVNTTKLLLHPESTVSTRLTFRSLKTFLPFPQERYPLHFTHWEQHLSPNAYQATLGVTWESASWHRPEPHQGSC